MRTALQLLVILGLLIVVAVAGIYSQRVPLATRSLNSVLRESGLQIVEMDSLEIGWRGLNIDRLVLGVGGEHTPQVLEGVELTYALLTLRPGRLSIQRARLQPPPPADTGTAAPLLLTRLLPRLFSVPLDSLEIAKLDIIGATVPLVHLPLSVSARPDPDKVTLELQDAAGTRLNLPVSRGVGGRVAADLQLVASDHTLLGLSAVLQPQAGRWQLSGTGRTDLKELAGFVSPVLPLPPVLSSVQGDLAFEISAQLGDDLSAPGEFRGDIIIPAATHLAATLDLPVDGGTTATVTARLVDNLSVAAARTGNGALQLSLGAAAMALQGEAPQGTASGTLSGLECRLETGAPTCRGALQLSGRMPELELAGPQASHLSGVQLEFSSSFEFREIFSLAWHSGPLLTVDRLQRGDSLLKQVALLADSEGALRYRIDTGQLTLQAGGASLLLPQVKLADLNLASRLNFSTLTFERDPGGEVTAGVHLSSESINLQHPGGWLPAVGLDTDITLAGNRLKAGGRVRSDQRRSLFEFSAEHDLDSGKGSGQLTTRQLAFDPGDKRLSRFFSHWPFELDIYQGTLSMSGNIDWQSADPLALQGRFQCHLEKLSGVYGDLGFIGLSGDVPLQLASPTAVFTPEDASLTLRQADVGIPVESISTRFRLDTARGELQLKSAEARLFGGRVWTDNAVYRADSPANRFDIGVDGLQLDQLLALAEYDAVEGTGSISGLLPVDFGTAGITMHRGMLAARPPGGVFRYRSAVAPGTNPAMAQAMAALSNYHYSIFQIEADYLDTGDLELRMELRGQNPDLEQSRPIHLNLNVTDNIPSLLRSLQAGRVIEDTVRKKVTGAR